jgi:hypothetical protein
MDWGLSEKELPLVERLIAEYRANETVMTCIMTKKDAREREKATAHANITLKAMALQSAEALAAAVAHFNASPNVVIAEFAAVDGQVVKLKTPETHKQAAIDAMSLPERKSLAMSFCTSKVSQLSKGFKGKLSGSAPSIVR